jgi:hypothetical protein
VAATIRNMIKKFFEILVMQCKMNQLAWIMSPVGVLRDVAPWQVSAKLTRWNLRRKQTARRNDFRSGLRGTCNQAGQREVGRGVRWAGVKAAGWSGRCNITTPTKRRLMARK